MNSRRIVMFAAAAAMFFTTLAPVPASAQSDPSYDPTPELIWDVGNADLSSQHTNQLRAIVRDMEEFEGHMYVAGKFLDVIAPDGSARSQPYLARFDLESGEWDSSFRPFVDDIVYAIDITTDGRLYAGGEMQGGAVLYDARTGERIEEFDPELTNSWGPPAVFDVEVVGDQVYLGGDFTDAQGVGLSNLARVNAIDGILDQSWLPQADLDTGTPLWAESLVFAIAVDPARERVYVAGKFGGINGDDRASYFAIIRPSDGQLIPNLRQGLPKGIPNHRDGYSMWMEDVQFAGDRVYVGGNGHQTMTMRASNLGLLNTFFTNNGVGQRATGGDTQVIHVGATTVWSGCHCWSSVGPFELGSYINGADGVMVEAEYNEWARDFATVNPFGQQDVNGAFGVNRSTNRLVPLTFDLGGQAGAYAIVEDSLGQLWLGGQFENVPSTGRQLSGMVRFALEGGVTPAPTPTPTPTPSPTPPNVPVVVPPGPGERPADDQIVRLYRAVFDRRPDAQGFAFWADRYAAGESLRSIAASFTTSPEWNARYGTGLSNGAFIDAIYDNILGRPGDPEGERFWLDAIESGRLSRVDVLVSVSESPENVAATGTNRPIGADEAQVLRLYQAAFGRSPDTAGYSFWLASLRGGRSLESLADEFSRSPEWAQRYGANPSTEQLIDALYRNVLGRAPDAAGERFWTSELSRRSTASVLVSFAESLENVKRTGTPR